MSDRVLHITSWYPTKDNPAEALWIQRHIQALDPHFEQDILHFQIDRGKPGKRQYCEGNVESLKLLIPINSYRLRELIAFIFLTFRLIRTSKKYTIINFHIAYPNLVYLIYLYSFFKSKWFITEHWSAYHYHFNSKKRLLRIKNIFTRNIPLISVSRCLLKDIEQFSGYKIRNSTVIPNCVDTKTFNFNTCQNKNYYLMASFWKWPKSPGVIFETWKQLVQSGYKFKLLVIGYGPLMEEMQKCVHDMSLTDHVEFTGLKAAEEIAVYMQSAKAFLMPSEYETFSAVTAEALCCGLPVIASKTGAITELINKENGILVSNENWYNAILEFERNSEYDRQRISEQSCSLYSFSAVGKKYAEFLKAF